MWCRYSFVKSLGVGHKMMLGMEGTFLGARGYRTSANWTALWTKVHEQAIRNFLGDVSQEADWGPFFPSLDRRNSRSKLRRRRRFFFPHRKKIGFFSVGGSGVYLHGDWDECFPFSPFFFFFFFFFSAIEGAKMFSFVSPFLRLSQDWTIFTTFWLCTDNKNTRATFLKKTKSYIIWRRHFQPWRVPLHLNQSPRTHSHRRPPPSSSFATVHIRTQHPSIYMYCQCMGKRLISAPVCSPLASSVILSLAKKGIEERECRTMPPFLRAHTMLGVT